MHRDDGAHFASRPGRGVGWRRAGRAGGSSPESAFQAEQLWPVVPETGLPPEVKLERVTQRRSSRGIA